MRSEITDTACFRLRSPRLPEMIFFDDVDIEYAEMKENLEKIEQLCGKRSVNQLIIVNDFTSFSMDALKLLVKFNKERCHLIEAEAVVVRSTANKLMFKFYINQNSKHYLLKLFDGAFEAKCWLEALAIADNKFL